MHGLIAVYLNGEWHRQDPRGNKRGMDAQFSLTTEQLAWRVDPNQGEIDYLQVHASPAGKVVDCVRDAEDALMLCRGACLQQVRGVFGLTWFVMKEAEGAEVTAGTDDPF